MKLRWLLAVISLVLVFIGVLMAQDDQGNPNDPGVNERANACYTGGSLAGKCHRTDADRDGDVDLLDVEFMWWCGWYLIRVENKMISPSAAPDGCFFLPAPPKAAPPVSVPTSTPCPFVASVPPAAIPLQNVIVTPDPCIDYSD